MYDFVIVGGGIAGSALARALAQNGARTLVIERADSFPDRVRGEGMHPWGVAEARELGILGALEGCAVEVPRWTIKVGDMPPRERDLRATTPQQSGTLDFYHPEMQEALLTAAQKAGAEVWRGARLTGLETGPSPRLTVVHENSTHVLSAEMIVGADGKDSDVRRLANIAVERDDENSVIVAGVRLRGLRMDPTSVQNRIPSRFGALSIFFPTGDDSWRVYYASTDAARARVLTGKRKLGTFVECCLETGAEAEWFSDSELDGPLANFEGADRWARTPAADGVVLVGDACASPDPSWGSGLSMALRGVRLLRDELLEGDGAAAAAQRYSERQKSEFERLQAVEKFFHRTFFDQGPEADAFRRKALPRYAAGTAPDMIGLGPDTPPERLSI